MTNPTIPSAALRCGAAIVSLAALGLAGCATTNRPFERSESTGAMASSVDSAAGQVAEVNGRIDGALRALDDLTNHPAADLRRQFDGYATAVKALENSSAKLREEAEAMERTGREYLVTWDRELATIQDEGLRNRTSERRRDVAERMDDLHADYVTARERLAPLIQRLNEIGSALRVDLTTAGVASVRPSFDNATDAAEPAREALRELGDAFRQAAVALAPVTQSRAS